MKHTQVNISNLLRGRQNKASVIEKQFKKPTLVNKNIRQFVNSLMVTHVLGYMMYDYTLLLIPMNQSSANLFLNVMVPGTFKHH